MPVFLLKYFIPIFLFVAVVVLGVSYIKNKKIDEIKEDMEEVEQNLKEKETK